MLKSLKAARRFAVASLLTFLTLQLLAGRASAQIGTYVTPRLVPIWAGTLTNAQSINNAGSFTNLLNYSGFHRVGLWLTVNTTNVAGYVPTAATNGTLTVQLDQSPGAIGGYTNQVLGTNVIYTTTNSFVWQPTLIASNQFVTYTNLDWQWADSVGQMKATKITTTGTNCVNWQIELDAVITP